MGFFTKSETVKATKEEDEQGNLITQVEPGVFETLPSGVGFRSFSPDHQTFPAFVKSCLRSISAGWVFPH